MAHHGLVAQEYGPLGLRRRGGVLNGGAHLPGVHGVDPGVAVGDREQDRRVRHPRLHVVVRRVPDEPFEFGRVGGRAELVVPGLAQPEALVSDHVEQRSLAHRGGAQVWPLRNSGADQQPAVRPAPADELVAGGPASTDQLLGRAVEVVEYCLLVLAHAGPVPLLTFLAAAAQPGDRVHAAGLDPGENRGGEGRRQADVEAAVTVEDGRPRFFGNGADRQRPRSLPVAVVSAGREDHHPDGRAVGRGICDLFGADRGHVDDAGSITANADPRKQTPIPNVQITAAAGGTIAQTKSDASGFFQMDWRAGVWPGEQVKLTFQHPDYQSVEITRSLSDQLYIARLNPLPPSVNPESPASEILLGDLRIRYAVKATTIVNIGSTAKTFEVANTGNVPCASNAPCSPDGAWKAALGSLTLDAGEGQEFQNVRVSCIAGPCPFTKIDRDDFTPGGRKIGVTVRAWSDTVTFLAEADVVQSILTDSIRLAYPSIFGRAMTFTLPATGQGPSITAEVNGVPIVFPSAPHSTSPGRPVAYKSHPIAPSSTTAPSVPAIAFANADRPLSSPLLLRVRDQTHSRHHPHITFFFSASVSDLRDFCETALPPLRVPNSTTRLHQKLAALLRIRVYALSAPDLALLAVCVISWAQSSSPIDTRIDALLARMSLDEKIGQMSQSTAMASPSPTPSRPKSAPDAGAPSSTREARRTAPKPSASRCEKAVSRIPLLFGRDVIHGYNTIFPIPLAQAATWDPDLVEQAARQAAREAATEGIRWTFAPMIDIARDPRWGRIAESLGEDPRLTATLAAAMVRGFQGSSLADPTAVAACAKHFAGYGAAKQAATITARGYPKFSSARCIFRPSAPP